MNIQIVDFSRTNHVKAFLKLLNAYMLDEMGLSQSLGKSHGDKVVANLEKHPSYKGFFIESEGEFIALANCFINYSTFATGPLINIHDLIVHPGFRQKGAGMALLKGIEDFARERHFCRINLEVRNDNAKAMALYKKTGFSECNPPMYFWEKRL
jgi:GNAT superfamily N-acetyltransferase